MLFSKENDISFRYLKNVSVEGDQGKPNVEFTQDGVLKSAELKIMNLRPGLSKQLVWEEVSEAKKHLHPSLSRHPQNYSRPRASISHRSASGKQNVETERLSEIGKSPSWKILVSLEDSREFGRKSWRKRLAPLLRRRILSRFLLNSLSLYRLDYLTPSCPRRWFIPP